MTQPLWYVQIHGTVKGPFPSPQIKEMLELGELSPADLVSLDRKQWLSIARSGHFHPGPTPAKPVAAPQDQAWEQERERARERWLREEEATPADIPLPARDDARRSALAHDHDATRHLVEAQANRKPRLILAGFALLAVVGLGVAVWQGEGDDTIRASFEKVSNCALPPAEGVSWAGCVRTGEILRGARLRNADLSAGIYDSADLTGADLAYANLRRASLRGANLRSVKLAGAALDGADLTGADLTGADLRYATLTGASLAGVRWDGASLGKATWSDGRPCPDSVVGPCR